MPNLLKLSRLIDRLNAAVGRWMAWLVLAAVLISAGNAVVRKLFNSSSNAFLEIQWYLFAAVFLLVAGGTTLFFLVRRIRRGWRSWKDKDRTAP